MRAAVAAWLPIEPVHRLLAGSPAGGRSDSAWARPSPGFGSPGPRPSLFQTSSFSQALEELEMVSRWNSTFKPFHNAHFSIRMPRVFDAYVIRWKNARRMMEKCSRPGIWVKPLFHLTSGLFPSCTCAVQKFRCQRRSSSEIADGKMALMENLLTLCHADGIPSRTQSSQFPF